jgi:hypothetical protein
MSASERKAFTRGAVWWGSFCRMKAGPEIVEREADSRYPDSPCKNVRKIVVEWLKANGYDGLYHSIICKKGCTPKDTTFLCRCSNGCRPGVLVDGKIRERVDEYRGTLKDAAADALDY